MRRVRVKRGKGDRWLVGGDGETVRTSRGGGVVTEVAGGS